MTMTISTNNLVTLNGNIIGRIDKESYQMRSGIRGETTIFTGEIGSFNTPNKISAPLYIPTYPGSVSDWKINPEFVSEVEEII